MSRIRIKNFGPIKEGCLDNDGWIDIKKVTVFIGNQGSGKSTVAKLISTFMWIEKAIVRGDYEKKWFEKRNKLKNHYLSYHRLENYFDGSGGLFDETEIEYQGDACKLVYKKGELRIFENKKFQYSLPQIMYIPAERNFISYVKSPKELKFSSDSLKEFLSEFDKAKTMIKGPMPLPINKVDIEYDKLNDIINIKGDDYKIRLTEASSGFQSLVPLYLVSWFLANSVKKQSQVSPESMSAEERERFEKGVKEIWENESLTEEQRRIALSVLSSKFNKSSFINIVEEPEQNLFPSSQWNMLKSLLEFNNLNEGNKLLITTHSPYLISYLSISIQGKYLQNEIKKHNRKELLDELKKVISEEALIDSSEVVIYQLTEKNGSVKKLDNSQGIPSDKNFLNQSIRNGNILFDTLLEIEEKL